ncbi:MAG TPA: Spy/CpxP family protein refolding chaperone [Steroidobacteraceae bacterium]|nr:Spy/CpxP family protein refolding chaperone [Steroidobacteraceae bacterium]
MKSNGMRILLAAAVAALGVGAMGAADAQSTSSAPAPGAPGHHFRGHFRGGFRGGPGGRFVGSLLRGVREEGKTNPQLALTAQQKDTIKSILKSARPSGPPAAGQFDVTVAGNPASPDYAAAIQSAQASAQARLQKETSLASQIYGVLTPQQQAALPAALAAVKAQAQARRAAWLQKHAGAAAGTAG